MARLLCSFQGLATQVEGHAVHVVTADGRHHFFRDGEVETVCGNDTCGTGTRRTRTIARRNHPQNGGERNSCNGQNSELDFHEIEADGAALRCCGLFIEQEKPLVGQFGLSQ